MQTITKMLNVRSLYKYTVKLLLISPLEYWGITAIATTSPRPRLLKTFLKSRLEWRTASRRAGNRKLFFLRHQDLLAFASSCLSRDLNDYNNGDQASHALPRTACPPTSTTSEMRTVVRGALSPTANEATVSALNHRSRVSFTAFLWDKIFSRQDFKSSITGPASTPIAPQGSNLSLFRTASAAVTAVFSMLIPVSEKNFSV